MVNITEKIKDIEEEMKKTQKVRPLPQNVKLISLIFYYRIKPQVGNATRNSRVKAENIMETS